MKKYLLSIGAVAVTIAPIVTIVSCTKKKKPAPTVIQYSTKAVKALKLVTDKAIKNKMNEVLTKEIKKQSAEDVIRDREVAITEAITPLVSEKIKGTDVEKIRVELEIEITFKASEDNTTLTANIGVKGVKGGNRSIEIKGFNQAHIDAIPTIKVVDTITNEMVKHLVDVKTKKASVGVKKITLENILKLDVIKDLSPEKKALISVSTEAKDVDGTIKVTITVLKTPKVITLEGFLTTSQENIDIANKALKDFEIADLKKTIISFPEVVSKLEDKINAAHVTQLGSFEKLKDAQKTLITVESKADDDSGTLNITISVTGGETKKYKMTGFVTLDIAKAKVAAAKVTQEMLKSIVDKKDKKAFASTIVITKKEIIELGVFKDLSDAQKALITVENVADDAKRELIVKILVNGLKANENTFTGFKAFTDNEKKAVELQKKITPKLFIALKGKSTDAKEWAEKLINKAIFENEIFKGVSEEVKKLICIKIIYSSDNLQVGFEFSLKSNKVIYKEGWIKFKPQK